jgi:hypothetical protein
MYTPDPTIPRSPASFTALLFDAGPGPWRAPQRIEVGAEWTPIPGTGVAVRMPVPPATQRSRDLMATRRALADEALVRRMVAECAALVEGVSL